jgi:hypothetical protein
MAIQFLSNIRINDEYTLPSADGTADQIIQTDGAGNLSFVDLSSISGSGTTNVLPIWLNGPNGELSDSLITQTKIDGGTVFDLNAITTGPYTPAINTKLLDLNSGGAQKFSITQDGGGGVILPSGGGVTNPGPSFNMGGGAFSNGKSGVAMGSTTTAFGNGSLAANFLTLASGGGASAFGLLTEAGGLASASFGNKTKASGLYTIASGQDSIASGQSSVAIGEKGDAQGKNTFVSGFGGTATGNNAVKFGYEGSASGNNSAKFGFESVASGNNSFASGWQTVASGLQSVATGDNNVVSNNNSFVGGKNSTVTGSESISYGITNTISANFCTIFGNQNTIPSGGFLSFIAGDENNAGTLGKQQLIGTGLTGQNSNQGGVYLGRYNDSTDPYSRFQIGNGTTTVNRVNALSINYQGRVKLPTYGSGSVTGTTTYNLAVDADGKIIETPHTLEDLLDTEIESGRVRLSTLTTPGSGYTVANNVPTTGGSGTGLEINILTLGVGDSIATYSIAPIRDGANYVAGDVVTVNAGNVDATITIDETWPLAGNTFVYNANDDVWINDATLTVDYINKRVGVGTTNPNVGFHCDLKAKFRNEVRIDQKSNNTILGEGSNYDNLIGAANTAVGTNVMAAATTANNNSILGYNAFNAALSGSRNVAIGSGAIGLTTAIGQSNVAIGYQALQNGVGGYNIAIGEGAISNSTGGSSNVSIGRNTLVNNTSSNSVAVGERALQNNTNGAFNTAVGAQSLNAVTGGTGRQNVGLGYQAGNNITTGQNNIVIGHQSSASTATTSNEITLGNSSISVLRCAVTTITSLSDERDKTDIANLEYGLDFINSLSPKQFTWNQRPEYAIEIDDDGNETQVEVENANKGKKDFGFIAQDVQSVDNDILRLVYAENPEKLEMSYGKLVPILVQAIKDLTNRIQALEA